MKNSLSRRSYPVASSPRHVTWLKLWSVSCLSLALMLMVSCSSTSPNVTPQGRQASAETRALGAGAEVLQVAGAPSALDIHLVGFHPMADDPSIQMEAHHFCRQVNEDFAQCAVFDSDGGDANLNGIEYIISSLLYEQLPEEEKQYWHPHNYEILSGQLVAPGLPDAAETALMEGKINSYGKTFHLWNTGSAAVEGDELPMGAPMLAWSFNADGEIDETLLVARDEAMNIDTNQIRQERAVLIDMADPQEGVDMLAGAFPDREKPVGIEDRENSRQGRGGGPITPSEDQKDTEEKKDESRDTRENSDESSGD